MDLPKIEYVSVLPEIYSYYSLTVGETYAVTNSYYNEDGDMMINLIDDLDEVCLLNTGVNEFYDYFIVLGDLEDVLCLDFKEGDSHD